MKARFIIIAVVTLILGGCAKKAAVTRIVLRVPETFSGLVHVTPCISAAAKDGPIALGDENEGFTSACPVGDVEVEVHKGAKTFVIAPENVNVRRRASGEPRAITFQVL
jgi:hypothetical protein